MCDLSKLQHLDLNFTNIEELPDLDIFPELHVLNMRNNPINRLNVKANLLKLKYLDISNTKVQNIGFLHNFPKSKTQSNDNLPIFYFVYHEAHLQCHLRSLPDR